MVIDAALIKVKEVNEEEESTIIISILGKKAFKLVCRIQDLLSYALEHQSVSLSPELISKTHQLLVMATQRWSLVVKGEEEGPTPSWLKRYLSREIPLGVYQAWDKKE